MSSFNINSGSYFIDRYWLTVQWGKKFEIMHYNNKRVYKIECIISKLTKTNLLVVIFSVSTFKMYQIKIAFD